MSESPPTAQHRNDIYGNLEAQKVTPTIAAATVVLLRATPAAVGEGSVVRDQGGGLFEVLMLRKNSKIAFGGMWVFPGGRIDPEDYRGGTDLEAAARTAAAREAHEEAGVETSPEEFAWFAHWTPPPSTRKRFATYFFATAVEADEVQIDGGEILEHAWIAPRRALERHAAGEIDLAPPTWVSLYDLSRRGSAAQALREFEARAPRVYQTRVGQRSDGVRVALWKGDAGYEDSDADREGARHRLVMAPGGFHFEHPEGEY